MVSEAEILATVQRWWLAMRRGERSLPEAGRECFEDLGRLSYAGTPEGERASSPFAYLANRPGNYPSGREHG
jgi:hypothetical protein